MYLLGNAFHRFFVSFRRSFFPSVNYSRFPFATATRYIVLPISAGIKFAFEQLEIQSARRILFGKYFATYVLFFLVVISSVRGYSQGLLISRQKRILNAARYYEVGHEYLIPMETRMWADRSLYNDLMPQVYLALRIFLPNLCFTEMNIHKCTATEKLRKKLQPRVRINYLSPNGVDCHSYNTKGSRKLDKMNDGDSMGVREPSRNSIA